MYDGNPRMEPGAIVCRVAPSFIRFGNFEILASRDNPAILGQLIDFTIDRDFPDLKGDQKDKRVRWFHEICERTAQLMVHWMRVGFVHGVMNTDNMSTLGLTIDYGPYGWVDNFDLDWTPNTTDAAYHRYAFGKQAPIAQWNLARLAQAVYEVMPYENELKSSLEHFGHLFTKSNEAMLASKFGFYFVDENKKKLIEEALLLMQQSEVDMTLFFRRLANLDLAKPNVMIFNDVFYNDDLKMQYQLQWDHWFSAYVQALKHEEQDTEKRRKHMNAVNPCYVLRNYMAQEAIDLAEKGDLSRLHELTEVLKNPYVENKNYDKFAQKRPDWAKNRAGCSKLSCSS